LEEGKGGRRGGLLVLVGSCCERFRRHLWEDWGKERCASLESREAQVRGWSWRHCLDGMRLPARVDGGDGKVWEMEDVTGSLEFGVERRRAYLWR
jgi:hypothetical protein